MVRILLCCVDLGYFNKMHPFTGVDSINMALSDGFNAFIGPFKAMSMCAFLFFIFNKLVSADESLLEPSTLIIACPTLCPVNTNSSSLSFYFYFPTLIYFCYSNNTSAWQLCIKRIMFFLHAQNTKIITFPLSLVKVFSVCMFDLV